MSVRSTRPPSSVEHPPPDPPPQAGERNPVNPSAQAGEGNPVNPSAQVGEGNPVNPSAQVGEGNPLNSPAQLGEGNAAELAARRSRAARRRRVIVYALRLAFAVAWIGRWELSSRMNWVDPFFVGQPSGVVARLWTWITEGTAL